MNESGTGLPLSAGRRVISSGLRASGLGLQRSGQAISKLGHRINVMRFGRLSFRPRSSDVFLVTYPRSGTTWLQMILYQLTSDGDLDFTHISERVPWFERLTISRRDIEEMPSPRAFKSHLSWGQIPKVPCRFVYMARRASDVAVSYYHFYRSHRRFEGDFDEFFDMFLRGKVDSGTWAAHVAGWWARRGRPNVFFCWYEQALADRERFIRDLADFCEIPLSPARLDRVLERSSFEFMKANEKRFDVIEEALLEMGAISGTFLRKGRAGEGKTVLSPEQLVRIDAEVKRAFGTTLAESRQTAPARTGR